MEFKREEEMTPDERAHANASADAAKSTTNRYGKGNVGNVGTMWLANAGTMWDLNGDMVLRVLVDMSLARRHVW